MNKEDEELHTMLESMPNSSSEEVLSMYRDVFEEVVEGFVALQNNREDGNSRVLCSVLLCSINL